MRGGACVARKTKWPGTLPHSGALSLPCSPAPPAPARPAPPLYNPGVMPKEKEDVLDPLGAALKLLRMVAELHARGFQRLRIAPGLAPAGGDWRCALVPASRMDPAHGAGEQVGNLLAARYSTSEDYHFFGWNDGAKMSIKEMAESFVRTFTTVCEQALGPDPVYANWFLSVVHAAEHGALPVAFSEASHPSVDERLATTQADVWLMWPPNIPLGLAPSSTHKPE